MSLQHTLTVMSQLSSSQPSFPDLQSLLQSVLNTNATVANRQSCSGGCIHRAEIVTFSDGFSCFVKSSRKAQDMFDLEAKGLALLGEGPLRVPRVLSTGSYSDVDCLILEAVQTGAPNADFFEQLGAGLADTHRQQTQSDFGWLWDNYLGTTVQPNQRHRNWVEFFRDERLVHQLQLARSRGLGSRELFKLGEKLCERLDRLLGLPEDPPSLLHGDLWNGNFLSSDAGSPVLIDPAVYYGRREADLAMPALFGGFPSSFWGAYQENWPLEGGWEDRLEIYKLYHLLNHLNLFGSGYLDACVEILRRFA